MKFLLWTKYGYWERGEFHRSILKATYIRISQKLRRLYNRASSQIGYYGFVKALKVFCFKKLKQMSKNPDNWAALKLEKIEGEESRLWLAIDKAGASNFPEAPAPGKPDTRPIYRADGQITNLKALPMPGYHGRNRKRGSEPLTVKQYAARYGNERPVPKFAVGTTIDPEASPEHWKNTETGATTDTMSPHPSQAEELEVLGAALQGHSTSLLLKKGA